MAILDDVKSVLRVDGTDFNTEINDLIASALADMVSSGVVASAAVTTDPLVKMAVMTYCKANFDSNKNSEKLQLIYEGIRDKLSLLSEYNTVTP